MRLTQRIAFLILCTGSVVPAVSVGTESPVVVRTVAVETERVHPAFVTAGRLSVKTQDLSFKISGRLIDILVEEGDAVSRGQLLANLEQIDARDKLRDAQAQLEQAANRYVRIKALFEADKASADEHDLARRTHQQAVVGRDQARINLERCRLMAPADGIIGVKYFEYPRTVSAGTPIYALQRADRPWLVEVDNLTARQVLSVSNGDLVSVEFAEYPREQFPGRVSLVGQEAEQGDGLYRLEVTVAPDRPLKPGMLARVTLQGATATESSLVPLEALRNMRGDQGEVYVPNSDGTEAQRVPVQVLDVRAGKAVLARPLDYSRVISFGRDLNDGSRIEIVK